VAALCKVNKHPTGCCELNRKSTGEGHTVAGNYHVMRDTCTESLHLISGYQVNRNKF